ncbi:MAG: M14 family zinc carboxypeptidase, partial [Candidatus Bathyarchaeota archaeon]|nr:M14 family zinc carboxypeptidase [Candidatus Bathyarchaeota archaeon]
MDYEGIVRAVPEYERFMTVDELNESSRRLADKHPDLVELFQIGESTREEPIYALKIGEGKRKAILVGFPHPNEPIGGLAIEYLSSRLVEDECLREHLGFTWYFVKVADVDGARLNEGWFKEKYDNIRYMLNRYRPPARRQVDRSFPVEYKTLKWDKPMPETKVLMNMIDTVKPDFVFTLHNSSFGGAYFYISEPCPPLYPKLQGLVVSQGLPLHLGEPYPYFRKLADGMFHIPVEEEIYDFLEKYYDKNPATIRNSGAGIWDYAKRVSNAFTIICEVPYIYDERIADATPTTITKREAVLKSLEISEEV